MKKHTSLILILLAGAAAHAATTNTTLTVTNAAVSLTSLTATGPATLTNIGSGTFTATITTGSSGTLTAQYTITFSGSLTGSTLAGAITLPLTVLTGATSATGSGTVTSGTGNFAGATGTFPSLLGSGSISPTGAISVTFSGAGTITTGGSTGPPAPTITQVADAAAYGSSIAQGSIFIVKGANLSASGFNQFGFPLPTSSGGVSVTFTPTAGGTGTPVYLIYTYNQSGVNQLAAVLPSTLAAGTYNVTVTNNTGTTSAPFRTTVIPRRIALFTQDSTGGGLVVAQNFISATRVDVNRLTTGSVSGITISPAKPGQTLIAWGTGMGPVTGGDNVASPGFNFAANGVPVQVIVGGMTITPAYAGRAPGLAAEDQINFTLPSNVPTGCTVSLQISVNGVLSNPTYISIAPSTSADACVQPGFTTPQLQALDQGGTYNTGGFSLIQLAETLPSVGSVKIDEVAGSFIQYTAFELGSIPQLQTLTPTQISPSGSCQVIPITTGSSTSALLAGTGIALDAGTITINGPGGSNITNQPLTETSNTYSLLLGEEGLTTQIPGVLNGTLVAGTYTLTGAGGTDVGKFTASLTLGTPLNVTGGLPLTVVRSAGLTLNWTGGNPNDIVEIAGFSGTISGSGATTTETGTAFVCLTTAGPGTFTVPSSILSQLPAVTPSITGGTSSSFLEVVSIPVPTSGSGTFSAPLTLAGAARIA